MKVMREVCRTNTKGVKHGNLCILRKAPPAEINIITKCIIEILDWLKRGEYDGCVC